MSLAALLAGAGAVGAPSGGAGAVSVDVNGPTQVVIRNLVPPQSGPSGHAGGSAPSGGTGAGDQTPQLTPGLLCLDALSYGSGVPLVDVLNDPSSLSVCGIAAGGAAAGPTPEQAAGQAWEHTVTLPAPAPAVRPGLAIVGQLAYLETGDPTTMTWRGDALGIAVSITAHSTYDVNWGDGTTDAGLVGPGEPWPDGHITHAYQYAGDYALVVTQRWTATYQAGASSGNIANALFTRGRLVLPVRDVQANRD